MIDARYAESGRQAYMNMIPSKAPAGIMELYNAVLARGSMSMSQRQTSQSAVDPAARLAQLEPEVSRIIAEIDSGKYSADVQEGIQAFKQWISDISPPTLNS